MSSVSRRFRSTSEVVGVGSFGRVYGVRGDPGKVIKTIEDSHDVHPSMLLEVAGLARLQALRDVVPRVHGIAVDIAGGRAVHVTMDRFECSLLTFRNRVFSENPLRIVPLLHGFLRALAGMWHARVRNLDIKPENVLVDPARNRVVLCDFNMALLALPRGHDRVPYKDLEYTRWYRAPELLLRARTFDPLKTDMFAAGAALLHLCARTYPACGDSEMEQLMLWMQVCGRPTVPDARRALDAFPHWPDGAETTPSAHVHPLIQTHAPALCRLINALMHANPEKRPTLDEFQGMLAGVVDVSDVVVPPPLPHRPVRTPCVSTKNRLILADWLVEVASLKKLFGPTVPCAMLVVDAYGARRGRFNYRELQLVGMAACHLAHNATRQTPRSLTMWAHLCKGAFTEEQVGTAAMHILHIVPDAFGLMQASEYFLALAHGIARDASEAFVLSCLSLYGPDASDAVQNVKELHDAVHAKRALPGFRFLQGAAQLIKQCATPPYVAWYAMMTDGVECRDGDTADDVTELASSMTVAPAQPVGPV